MQVNPSPLGRACALPGPISEGEYRVRREESANDDDEEESARRDHEEV